MKLGMISLGCAKNQIDTELFLGMAQKYDLVITNEIEDADIIVVNTCGFIDQAKKEAIDTILEVSDYKRIRTKDKIIIAMGCLVERYYQELHELLPEVDYFIPIRDYQNLDQLFKKITKSIETYHFDYLNRVLTTLPHSVYLRIGEGCNNRCSYCAIPLIRGNYVSRPFDDIISEARHLAKCGATEITIIAQDTTRYGTDFETNHRRIENLLHEISLIPNVAWVRILYLYPDEVTDSLLEEMKNNPKIVPYFDLPLQHASDKILKAMNRRGSKAEIMTLIEKIKAIPQAILRTTFIVGFPGETNDDFLELVDFVKTIKFDRVGVFMYSDEENTTGFEMTPKIPKTVMKKRLKELIKVQQIISYENNKTQIGKTLKVLIDRFDFDKNKYVGRNYAYAPDDVDGVIYITSEKTLLVGEFYQVKIIKTSTYDLYGVILN